MVYKNIYLNYLKTCLIFLVIIFSTSFIFLLLFNNYKNYQFNLINIFNSIDKSTLNYLKISLKSLDNISYYYLIYLNLGLILYSMLSCILGIKTIKDDEIYKNLFVTMLFKKKNHLIKKIILALLNIFMIDLMMFLFLGIYFKIYDIDNAFLISFLLMLADIVIEITIYSITIAISAFIKTNSIIYLTSSLVLIFFIIINIIYKITSFKPLAFLSPLCYFDFISIIDNLSLSLDYFASMIIISTFGLNLAICEYRR